MTILPNNLYTFRGRNGDPTFVDYVLVSKEIESYVQNHTVYDSAVASDHRTLITNVRPTPDMTVKNKPKRLKTHKLADPKIAKEFRVMIEKELEQLN